MIQGCCSDERTAVSPVSGCAAHWGYLLDNFLICLSRTTEEDEYGGCLESRVRVITEMVEGIHQVCGSDFELLPLVSASRASSLL